MASCTPSVTVNIDDDLKDRMERHPEINWSEVTRQAIQEKIEALEVMDELTSGSELTEGDVADIADKINFWDNLDVFEQLGVMEPPTA